MATINSTRPIKSSQQKKSLKEQNRSYLWIIIAGNTLFLYGVVRANAIRVEGLRALFADADKLLPVGFAVVIATVLNGLLSAESKARVVFLRWNHALPGHRAFSDYARLDPRIDLAMLIHLQGSELPVDPVEQNRVCYKFYRRMENDPAVAQAYRGSTCSSVIMQVYLRCSWFSTVGWELSPYHRLELVCSTVCCFYSSMRWSVTQRLTTAFGSSLLSSRGEESAEFRSGICTESGRRVVRDTFKSALIRDSERQTLCANWNILEHDCGWEGL
jgi:hypothetical protein